MDTNTDDKFDQLVADELYFDKDKKKEFVTSSFIHKLQLKHYLLFNVLPPVSAVILGILLVSTNQLVVGAVEIISALTLWMLSGLGITVGYHRLFTHKSFQTVRGVKIMLQWCGLIAGQGGVISWSAIHRQHHKYSDKHGDPHSPNLTGEGHLKAARGILHSHFTWMKKHQYPNVLHYVPDLIKDRDLLFLDKHYGKIFISGLLLPGLVSFVYTPNLGGFLSGLLIGGLLRVIFLGNTIWAINSFLHRYGNRPFRTHDHSHNNAWVSAISFGEAWHNNHHAFPGSAAFGLAWYQFDPGYYLIRLLEFLNLASNVSTPNKPQISRRMEKSSES